MTRLSGGFGKKLIRLWRGVGITLTRLQGDFGQILANVWEEFGESGRVW